MNSKNSKGGVYTLTDKNIDQIEGLALLLNHLLKRVSIEQAYSTVRIYRRSLRDISLFHGALPDSLELDEILDYLSFLKERGNGWAKIRLDVAALRYFYREICHDPLPAAGIPYPKEEKSLPKILSREELVRLFDAAKNPKHRVMLRLIYLHVSEVLLKGAFSPLDNIEE